MAPVAKAIGMKVVVTYHLKNYEHQKWNRLAKLSLRVGELFAVLFADQVIGDAKSLTRDLRSRFPGAASRIHFVPNGATHVADERIEPEIHGKLLGRYGLERSSYVVSVGRLVPEKGFHDLLTPFERSSFPGKLVIAGTADHRDVYSQRLLQRTDRRIVFTGFVSHEVVRALLTNASLFVLPSHNEGLPIAALKAIAAGFQYC